jgi:hypothetical protein
MTKLLDDHLIDKSGHLRLEDVYFKGKLAGKKWKYTQTLDLLKRIRLVD